ncbi:eukaryotic translation initiation factor 3 subunit E [Perkinsus olseni]|uniref:Eukaryotic translation initiation factor 3 subunit E n=1 Tax=Perkinsus olseni TaxID=32597 RepID=A0A7J6MYZ1_PEROL|nr:eukaryotic translation initiation factor 3 subunit E [Perkinsus olseni]
MSKTATTTATCILPPPPDFGSISLTGKAVDFHRNLLVGIREPHLMLPIIDYLEEHQLYDESSIKALRIQVVKATRMVDLLGDLTGKDMTDARAALAEELKEAEEAADSAMKLIKNQEVWEKIQANAEGSSFGALVLDYGFPDDILDRVYHLGRLNYQAGRYEDAYSALQVYRTLLTYLGPKQHHKHMLSSLWGSLACAILTGQFDASVDLIGKLFELYQYESSGPSRPVGEGAGNYAESVAVLMHWSLFALFRAPSPSLCLSPKLVMLLTRVKALQAIISTGNFHLLRYAAIVALISPQQLAQSGASKRDTPASTPVSLLAQYLEGQEEWYCDCFTKLMVAVYVKADFVAAKEAARECLKTTDYFTSVIERENQIALGVGRTLAGALMLVYRVHDLATSLTKMIEMVVLHVKRTSPKGEFLFETTAGISVTDLKKQLVELHNKRIKCLRLADALRELAKHGPLRPEETRGLSEEVGKMSHLDVNAYGTPTAPDEHAYRTGCPPPAHAAAVLTRTADEASAAVSHNLVAHRRALDLGEIGEGWSTSSATTIQEQLDCMQGAVMIAYPAFHRLPSFDPARIELENAEAPDGQSENQDVLEPAQSSLWWAGKELESGKTLSDYIGKNEKTKIIVKLMASSQGAPVREPRVDEETHKAMLAYYYKKQEEQKALNNNDDDSYLTSEWANPKALKGVLLLEVGEVSAGGLID